MLTAAKIRPLEEFFELPKPRKHKPLKANKETAIALNKGSIICLCDAPNNKPPEVLRTFRVEDLNITQRRDNSSWVRWSIIDDDGCWFEGSTQQVDLYKGLFLIKPSTPLRVYPSDYGPRAVFLLKLPSRYRAHHLAYLRRHSPQSLVKPHVVN